MVLDDNYRFILAGEEFSAATAEDRIALLGMALDDFGDITGIKEVITDHGSQFFANKSDKNGE